MRWLLAILLCFPLIAFGQKKNDAQTIIPEMKLAINQFWPDIPRREFPLGIVEQESLMRIKAELKTHREYGCGIGQFTVAFNKDGTVRFDALEETKRLDPSLAGWNWKDCSNLFYQSRGVVLKLKSQQRDCFAIMNSAEDALKCNAAKYNGGGGSVATRVRLCRATPGCNPTIWDGNLDKQCPQSKTKVQGYGESFCEINSKYPGRVFARMVKYKDRI